VVNFHRTTHFAIAISRFRGGALDATTSTSTTAEGEAHLDERMSMDENKVNLRVQYCGG